MSAGRLDVRIWKIQVRRGARGTTYRVRWRVGTNDFQRTFGTRSLADSYRADLKAATGRGEGFDAATGLPVSTLIEDRPVISCYRHACEYVDAKWKFSAAKSRVGVAEALTTAMTALVPASGSAPTVSELRHALYGWAFNPPRRRGPLPEDVAATLSWIERHSLPVEALGDPALLRKVVDALSCKQDGTPAAASTYRRKRAVFNSCLEFAVEMRRLPSNPLTRMKRAIPKPPEAVDPRVLVDRTRAEALLAGVGAQGVTGKRLVAFFGCMYYGALRPSEAVNLRENNITLPDSEDGWGELHLSRSTPVAGPDGPTLGIDAMSGSSSTVPWATCASCPVTHVWSSCSGTTSLNTAPHPTADCFGVHGAARSPRASTRASGLRLARRR